MKDKTFKIPLWSFFCLQLALILCLSCKKPQPNTVNTNDIIGNWRLVSEFGGFVGYYKYPTDYSYIYSFKPNGAYSINIKDSIAKTGTYSITFKRSSSTSHLEPFIVFVSSNTSETVQASLYYQIKADTLTISYDNSIQPVGSLYVRIH